MVLLIIIPFLNGYFIGNINPTFSDKPIYSKMAMIGLAIRRVGWLETPFKGVKIIINNPRPLIWNTPMEAIVYPLVI